MFTTSKLIQMTTGRIKMLDAALTSGDYSSTAYRTREGGAKGLSEAREALARLEARGDEPCHYCGVTTHRGVCEQCGTVPSMLEEF